MAIDQLHSNTLANKAINKGIQGGTTAPKPDQDASPAQGNAPQAGKVSISPEANRLSQLEAKINAADDVDSQRVADIKRAIADGSYQVNADQIAGKMLAQEEQFAK